MLWDTGSADNTVDVAKATAESLQMPLTVERVKWRGFGDTWSRLLRRTRSLAGKKGWIWLLDADETIERTDVALPSPEAGVTGYQVTRLEGDGDWENPGIRIFSAMYEWGFRGERHAAPFCKFTRGEVRAFPVDVRNHRDGARGTGMSADEQRARFLADFELFSRDAARSKSTRSTYYAAQSAQDAGLVDEAQEWWKKRAEQTGNIDERYIAMLRSGQSERAWALDPGRLCAPMWLADLALSEGDRERAEHWTRCALSSSARVGFLTQRSHRWRRFVLGAQLGIVSPLSAIAGAEEHGCPDYARFALDLLAKVAQPSHSLPPGYRHAVEALAR